MGVGLVMLGLAWLAGGVAVAWASGTGVSDRHPVYVGVSVCAGCHGDQKAGHQFSKWRVSKHAAAYAALWSPQAKAIARVSGIPEEPQKSRMCLGCHATAADAEGWEREEGFRIGDGVQCERCHGAGSEYGTAEVMRDRERALRAGLMMPDERACMLCHNVKGSHVAVLGSADFAYAPAVEKIAHPVPAGTRGQAVSPRHPTPARGGAGSGADPPGGAGTASNSVDEQRYTGVAVCGGCHDGPQMGYQFSRWRVSRHARAFAVLGTAAGCEMARREGVSGDPQNETKCLRCHATAAGEDGRRLEKGFCVREGVQCESCHGAGSAYWPEAIMRDRQAARRSGLVLPTPESCRACHENAHGKAFDAAAAWVMIAHPTRLPQAKAGLRYRTPVNLALSPDGRELYVACEAADAVLVVDAATGAVLAEVATGGQPMDVAFHPDGTRAYVTLRLDDTLAVIDTRSRAVTRVVAVGDEPHGVLTDAAGNSVYVLNTWSDTISVIDAGVQREAKRLAASRSPWSLALSPDGKVLAATNALSRFVPFRAPPVSEITLLDAERGTVQARVAVPGANLMQGIAWHPSGDFALVTLNRTKSLVPMTRLVQGWTITNGLGILWRDGRVDQVLLDEPDQSFPDAADVACTPDGRYALVTSSGSDRVAVVDVAKLLELLQRATPAEREHVLPNHMGKATEFVVKHIPTPASPRGIICAPDGKRAYVANALDDSLTVIDLGRLEAVGRIDLGGPREITKVRYGERLFHSADITFRRQFSCHSCHPDGHVDGVTYDIEPDGIGVSPVDNRTLRGILDTAPFNWEGTNPSLQRQCGARLAVFFTRIDPFTPEELAAVDAYICTIPRPPNRYRAVGAELTPAQRRGKLLFEREAGNDGRLIPVENRCATCHPVPLYTDRTQRDVGTRMWLDRTGKFDVPHLNNIYDSAPYLHNGIAETLEEIWTRFNPHDTHGVTNDMTKDQLNDLIEYLKTL